MLKMMIRMDEHKIIAEGKYHLDRIYHMADQILLKIVFYMSRIRLDFWFITTPAKSLF